MFYLLRRFGCIVKPRHPGFFSGGGVFRNNSLSRGGVKLFDH